MHPDWDFAARDHGLTDRAGVTHPEPVIREFVRQLVIDSGKIPDVLLADYLDRMTAAELIDWATDTRGRFWGID
jgi:hypothetical protein